MNDEAKTYKRRVAGAFMLVAGDKIEEKVGGSDFIVTRKYDGIMTYLEYSDGEVEAFTSGGRRLSPDIPCLAEIATILKASGLTSVILAGELFATLNPNGRERVGDTLKAIADTGLHDKLRLALFDIVELEGKPFKPAHYRETLQKLEEITVGAKTARPVKGIEVSSRRQISSVFKKLVEEKGAEGLVVHSELPVVYKIKPRHTIDAVIIGYTTGDNGRENMVRDLLLGVMYPDGGILQIASVGAGLTDEMRIELEQRLAGLTVESEYITTDSRNVAFRMVRPSVVVEFSAIDGATENFEGIPKTNALLEYSPLTGYSLAMHMNGVAMHGTVFVRPRADKEAVYDDVRVEQVTDLWPFAENKRSKNEALLASEILERRVFLYQRALSRKVHKFVVWKTNKEHTGEYPAYVLHHTDYSFSRKQQLKRDLRISQSREQIFDLLQQMIADNIKKGWNEV